MGSPTLPSWRDVPLYWLDANRPLTAAERLVALDEYSRTNGMYMIVMAEPTGDDSPENYERLSQEGSAVDEIDWTGFPEACEASGAFAAGVFDAREATS